MKGNFEEKTSGAPRTVMRIEDGEEEGDDEPGGEDEPALLKESP